MHVTVFLKRIIGKEIDHNMLWSAKLSGSLQNRKVRLTDVRHMSGFKVLIFWEHSQHIKRLNFETEIEYSMVNRGASINTFFLLMERNSASAEEYQDHGIK